MSTSEPADHMLPYSSAYLRLDHLSHAAHNHVAHVNVATAAHNVLKRLEEILLAHHTGARVSKKLEGTSGTGGLTF